MTNIFFLFPYRSVGGVSFQFANCANYLYQNNLDLKIHIIDYENGTLSRFTSNGIVKHIYNDDNPLCFSSNNNVLIKQSSLVFNDFKIPIFNNGYKVIEWCCHPNNFVPKIFETDKKLISLLIKPFISNAKIYISKLIENNSIASIDNNCVHSFLDFYGLHTDSIDIIPVPLILEQPLKESVPTDSIKAVWVGRICDFKYTMLKYLIVRILSFNIDAKCTVSLEIIGGGEYFSFLKDKYSDENIIFVDELPKSKLIDFITTQSYDIAFAMGTSAIELASLKIPTILLNYSYKEIDSYEFSWFFERTKFSVGYELDSNEIFIDNFVEIINSLLKDYSSISLRCFDEAKLHDVKYVCDKLLSSIESAGLHKTSSLSLNSFYQSTIYFLYKKVLNNDSTL